jgi:predicted transposase YdaD
VAVKESATYQEIIREGMELGEAKGAINEARRVLLRQGRKKFGPPDDATLASLEALTDLGRLEELIDRILDASSWQQLLGNGS